MNSLRFRLVVGFSLIAVVPLAIAMLLLSRQIQATVRRDAEERLGLALRSAAAQIQRDAVLLDSRIEILARDPQLKRLFLIESGTDAELREALSAQRFLLDLDYLSILDTTGAVVAEGSGTPGRARTAAHDFRDALDRSNGMGVRLAPVRLGGPSPRVELALDAGRPILYRGETVGRLRGGILLDSGFLLGLANPADVRLALFDGADRLTSASFEHSDGLELPRPGSVERTVRERRPYLAQRLPLEIGPEPRPTLAGLVSTAAADETLSTLRLVTLLLGLIGVSLAVILGLVWSHQISRPVERLAAFSQRISRGDWNEPLAFESVRELSTLVSALERMRGDLRTYRDRLTAGERQAAYGQMARKVAHEIKNPLTPIAISIADLKRSYDLQRPDFPRILDEAVRTIGEEVERLKHLIQEFSEFGRFPAPRFEPVDTGELLADLGGLFGREVAADRLRVETGNGRSTLSADRAQLRQALINLIQNGLDAIPEGGHVTVRAEARGAQLALTVSDDGPGLSEDQRAQLFVPGFTTKAHGSGLGLTIVERIVSDHGGTIAVDSSPGHGVTFSIRLPFSSGV